MIREPERVWRFATVVLLLLMCTAAAIMAIEIAIYSGTAGGSIVIRFVVVIAVPFVWAAIVGAMHRKQLSQAMVFGLTALVFVAFVGAVDFANGRPLYSWVAAFDG